MTQEEARVRLRFFKKWTDKLARSNYFFHIILPKGMIIPLVVVVIIIVQTLVTLSDLSHDWSDYHTRQIRKYEFSKIDAQIIVSSFG